MSTIDSGPNPDERSTTTENACFEKIVGDFFVELQDFMANDNVLKHFLKRHKKECENIEKVVAIVNQNLSNSLNDIGRKRIMEKLDDLESSSKRFFDGAQSPDALGIVDTDFHKCLFIIADDEKSFNELQNEVGELKGDHQKIWGSIGVRTEHHYNLWEAHSEILAAINSNDVSRAVKAMHKHFAIVLAHYIQLLTPKQRKRKQWSSDQEDA